MLKTPFLGCSRVSLSGLSGVMHLVGFIRSRNCLVGEPQYGGQVKLLMTSVVGCILVLVFVTWGHPGLIAG